MTGPHASRLKHAVRDAALCASGKTRVRTIDANQEHAPGAEPLPGSRGRVGIAFRPAQASPRKISLGIQLTFVRPKLYYRARAEVAQLVEQRTENPRVGSSILPLGTIFFLLE